MAVRRGRERAPAPAPGRPSRRPSSVYDTRTSAKRACRRGFVHVNDSRGTCETLVEAGDVVEVREADGGSGQRALARELRRSGRTMTSRSRTRTRTARSW